MLTQKWIEQNKIKFILGVFLLLTIAAGSIYLGLILALPAVPAIAQISFIAGSTFTPAISLALGASAFSLAITSIINVKNTDYLYSFTGLANLSFKAAFMSSITFAGAAVGVVLAGAQLSIGVSSAIIAGANVISGIFYGTAQALFNRKELVAKRNLDKLNTLAPKAPTETPNPGSPESFYGLSFLKRGVNYLVGGQIENAENVLSTVESLTFWARACLDTVQNIVGPTDDAPNNDAKRHNKKAN